MFIIKHLQNITVLVIVFISLASAQPANLVLENMTISTTEFYQATNSITLGSNVIVTSTGDVTLDAPSITIKNLVYVIEGGELLVLSESTAVEVESEESLTPSEFILAQNYPNPFNPTTTLKYIIPENSFVTLKVYDILGKEVATLVNEEKSIGYYEVSFDATNLPSGTYFYSIKAGNFIDTKKMMLMK